MALVSHVYLVSGVFYWARDAVPGATMNLDWISRSSATRVTGLCSSGLNKVDECTHIPRSPSPGQGALTCVLTTLGNQPRDSGYALFIAGEVECSNMVKHEK
ncbi:hypothetical protein AYO22_03580 [Fonsecaea multimorphosa]|nr:hypothetical protein AYO22_03580 [Fonsecaea multimorphosa]